MANNSGSSEWLCERALLSPHNASVNHLNWSLMEEFPGDSHQYLSADRADSEEDVVTYPMEFLNSLDLPGMPAHILTLKVGSPVIVLRSIQPPKVTNGTRCVIQKLGNNVIEAKIATGRHKDEVILLPRIPFVPTDLPFRFRRLQFPIKPCFAMTINKGVYIL